MSSHTVLYVLSDLSGLLWDFPVSKSHWLHIGRVKHGWLRKRQGLKAQRADSVNLLAVIRVLECNTDVLIQLKSWDNFFCMADSSLLLFLHQQYLLLFHRQNVLCLAQEYRGTGKRAFLYNMVCSKSSSKPLFSLPLQSEHFSGST